MITAVDLLVRSMLERAAGVPGTLIGFQSPDSKWAQRAQSFRIAGNPATCLNVFLADLRENRSLRSNAVVNERNGAVLTVRRAPLRVDLHYLISAWHSADDSDQVPATMLEHALLSRVVAELAVTRLNTDVLLTVAQATALPEGMRSVDLPLTVLPVDGFPRLGEMWTSMGQGRSWRPAVYIVVTMPVAPEPKTAGGIVDTIVADITNGVGPYAPPLETVFVVGGTVVAASGPVAGARVELRGRPGGPADGRRDATVTDADAQFSFAGLRAGSYDLVLTHPDHPTPPPVTVVVPVPSGHVELPFN